MPEPGHSYELGEFFDLARDLFCIVGADGYHKLVNASFERVLGYSREELLSRPITDFVHPDDRERIRELAGVVFAGGDDMAFEDRIVCADGSVRRFEWNTRMLPDLGVAYSIGRDVTERAALAEEQAALRRVATLVAEHPESAALFSAVAREVATVLDVRGVIVDRFEPDGSQVTLGSAYDLELAGADAFLGVGVGLPLHPGTLAAAVFETHRAARVEDYSTLEGVMGDAARAAGVGSGCAAPIIVDGRLWGQMCVFSSRGTVLPAGTEHQLDDFVKLVATAISNYDARGNLRTVADEQAASAARGDAGRTRHALGRAVRCGVRGGRGARRSGRLCRGALRDRRHGDRDGRPRRSAPGGRAREARSGLHRRRGSQDRGGRTVRHRRSCGPGHARRSCRRSGSTLRWRARSWSRASSGARSRPSRACARSPPAWSDGSPTSPSWWRPRSPTCTRAPSSPPRARASPLPPTTNAGAVVRDLHDGAQQRLVHTVVTLKLAQRALERDAADAASLLGEALEQAQRATHELRELVHGILPAALTAGGLRAGVDALASRMPLPVAVDVCADRFPTRIEATAYFVVAEALTNVAKHAHAATAAIAARVQDGALRVEVRDDGIGGARPDGSGIQGLKDRLAALDGRLQVECPATGGTVVAAAIPIPTSA